VGSAQSIANCSSLAVDWSSLAIEPGSAERFTDPRTGLRLYPVRTQNGRLLALPGVTSILGSLATKDEKERLAEWRRKQIEKNFDPDARRKCGSRVHAMMEDLIRTGRGLYLPINERPDDRWISPCIEELQRDLIQAMGKSEVDRSNFIAESKKRGLNGAILRAIAGQLPELPVLEEIRDLLDWCFFSGIDKKLEVYDHIIWNERPLQSGYGHVWSAPPGDPARLARVWSTAWGFAGTPDIVARRRNGMLVLSDLKTSADPYFRLHGQAIPAHKEYAWRKLQKAILQCCAYSLAIKETLGLTIDGIEILVALPQVGRVQCFMVSREVINRETEKFKKLATKFWEKFKEQAN